MNLIKRYFSGHKRPGGISDLLVLAFPMMVSTAADGVMTFTDRLFLARLGPDQMNAALGGGLTFQMLTFFFIGLSGYSTALVAQYYGAGKLTKAPKVTFQAVLVVLLAWPFINALNPLVNHIFMNANLPVNQVGYQIEYLRVLTLGAIFSLLRHVLGCYFTGIGKTRIVMTSTIAAMLVNVVLDYGLIFGKLGLPALGVKGAAFATVFGSATAVLMLLVPYFNRRNRMVYAVLQSFRFDGRIMKKLLHFGYPAGLEFLLNFVAMFIMTLMFQSRGTAAATATTIMFNWDLVSFIPLLGIEIAVTSLVGRYMGAKRPQAAHRAALSAIKVGILYSIVVLFLFILIPEALVRVFHPATPSQAFEEAVPMAKAMIRIASIYVLAQAFMVAMIGTLRGAGDTFYTMVLSVGANWAFLPLVFITLNLMNLSVVWAWLAIVLVYMLFGYAIFRRFKTEKWKTIKVI